MFYAERNQNGQVVAIRKDPGRDDEAVDVVSEQEMLEFLTAGDGTDSYESLLRLTDRKIIRVLEDLIDLLIEKNLILLTDLPPGARERIGARKEVRRKMQQAFHLADDDVL